MRRFITFVAVLVAVLAIFPVYTRFKVSAAPIPPGVYLGGLDLSGLKDTQEIRQHLEYVYRQPIAVYFAGERLVLRPETIDFHVDVEQMVAEASQYLEGPTFVDIAVRAALGLEQRRRDVPVRFTLNGEKLRAWLATVAADYNRGPQPARVLPPTSRWSEGGTGEAHLPGGYVGAYSRDWTWIPGTPGYQLDVEASVPRVVAALTDDRTRTAELALTEIPPPAPSLTDLARELDRYLSNFPGFAAVYVQDLTSGQEGAVDADVSFSGMSTLKIAIAAAVMHKLDNGIDGGDATAVQVGQWLDYALGESNNYAANMLLQFLGDGDVTTGARRFTEFMRSLGFVNTYMQSGYDAQVALPEIPTPGNQRTDWNTNPDPNLQSTPAEMGRILAAIYDCTQGQGLLLEVYPDRFTPEECLSILFYMTHDEFQEMVWAGLPRPNATWIIHKHGFAFESHSDVALVWGPAGPYVISIFLYRRGWMDWATSNGTMKAVSRITWNFFDFLRRQEARTPGPPLLLTPPSGYIKIKDYIPTVATQGQR